MKTEFADRVSVEVDELCLGASSPLYAQVHAKLKADISGMQYGSKLPSEREFAKRFNIGRVTVRRAMSDLAKEGFIIRHPGRGSFVGDSVKINSVKDLSSGEVALVVPGTSLVCHTDIIEGVIEEGKRNNLKVKVFDCQLDTDKEYDIIEKLISNNIKQVILSPFLTDSFDKAYISLVKKVQDAKINFVLIDLYLPGVSTPVVMSDHFELGYMVTEHLIMQGHRKICFSCTAGYGVAGDSHLRGYKTALTDYGIKFNPDISVELSLAFCAEPTQKAIIKILKDNPDAFTAIATPQFSMTYGIVNALKELNLNIPSDIALVGAEVYQNPDLEYVTHVIRKNKEIGKRALSVLLENGNGKRKMHVLIKPELIIRSSCGVNRN